MVPLLSAFRTRGPTRTSFSPNELGLKLVGSLKAEPRCAPQLQTTGCFLASLIRRCEPSSAQHSEDPIRLSSRARERAQIAPLTGLADEWSPAGSVLAPGEPVYMPPPAGGQGKVRRGSFWAMVLVRARIPWCSKVRAKQPRASRASRGLRKKAFHRAEFSTATTTTTICAATNVCVTNVPSALACTIRRTHTRRRRRRKLSEWVSSIELAEWRRVSKDEQTSQLISSYLTHRPHCASD